MLPSIKYDLGEWTKSFFSGFEKNSRLGYRDRGNGRICLNMRANDCKRTSQKKVPSDEKLVPPQKNCIHSMYAYGYTYVQRIPQPLGSPKIRTRTNTSLTTTHPPRRCPPVAPLISPGNCPLPFRPCLPFPSKKNPCQISRGAFGPPDPSAQPNFKLGIGLHIQSGGPTSQYNNMHHVIYLFLLRSYLLETSTQASVKFKTACKMPHLPSEISKQFRT